jgi:hypothetical protein
VLHAVNFARRAVGDERGGEVLDSGDWDAALRLVSGAEYVLQTRLLVAATQVLGPEAAKGLMRHAVGLVVDYK